MGLIKDEVLVVRLSIVVNGGGFFKRGMNWM